MRVIAVLDLDDSDLFGPGGAYASDLQSGPVYVAEDVRASLRARLSEAGYFGELETPVRGTLISCEQVAPETLDLILSAAAVGLSGPGEEAEGPLEGIDDTPVLDKAWLTVEAMRQEVAS